MLFEITKSQGTRSDMLAGVQRLKLHGAKQEFRVRKINIDDLFAMMEDLFPCQYTISGPMDKLHSSGAISGCSKKD
jgi:hypothetical protein